LSWATAGGATPTLDAVLAQGGTSTRDATIGKLIVSGASTSEFSGPVILAKTSGNVGIGTTEAANAKLDVDGNIRIRGTGTELPAADASWRGVMYFLQGTLSTTPDKLYICMQNTNGSYQWVLLEQGD
jgi:hypothetical protein